MTQLHPPATLYKKGNDYIVEAYTEPEPIVSEYFTANAYGVQYDKWQASKVTLKIATRCINPILSILFDTAQLGIMAPRAQFEIKLNQGVDISSLLPRLEVRDGFVFLKPEQPVNEHCPTCGAKVKIVGDVTMHYEPVNEAEESWDDVLTNMIEHVGYCITNYDGARKYFEANYLPPKAKK